MRALIVGGAGFVGGYLADYLADTCGYSVAVTKMECNEFSKDGVSVYNMDLLEPENIRYVLNEVNPDVVFHLAAQSSVALSWKEPKLTVDVNINGSINLLNEIKTLNKQPKILLIGSGEEYGAIEGSYLPISENAPLNPMNIYAATKACQGMIGKIYAKAYGMNIIMTRSFNHIGPKQLPQFVVADFCRQVAEIEKGIKPSVIRVGNLAAKRDFTDVRDVVKAYELLAVKGNSGQVYNVGSGRAIAIDYILNTIINMAKVDINIEIDEERLRPIDVPVIEADIRKLKNDTGWAPEITIERTIEDTLNYWRGVI